MSLTAENQKIIFNKLKKSLKKCCPPMVHKKGSAHAFELIGNKSVPYGYKKEIVPGMYFCSVAIRKNSVVFYFFPCYMSPAFKGTAPSLFKCLKGKTCFHFTSPEQVNEKELDALLKQGITAWKKAGYMQ